MRITSFTGTIYINKPKSELSDKMLAALEPANTVIENYKGCSVFEFDNESGSFEIEQQENDALKALQNKTKHIYSERVLSNHNLENKLLFIKSYLDNYIDHDLWGWDYHDYD